MQVDPTVDRARRTRPHPPRVHQGDIDPAFPLSIDAGEKPASSRRRDQ